MAWRSSRASPASPCRSCGMSCKSGTNSRLKCLCSRKSWRITKGRFITGMTEKVLTGQWGWRAPSLFFSEEVEDDVNYYSFCAPSPPPSSTSTARPESGIRRLWVMKESVSSMFSNSLGIHWTTLLSLSYVFKEFQSLECFLHLLILKSAFIFALASLVWTISLIKLVLNCIRVPDFYLFFYLFHLWTGSSLP